MTLIENEVDEVTNMDKNLIKEKINKILAAVQRFENFTGLKEECPIGIISMDNWEWPQGVALSALYRYYRETGDKSVLEYLIRWYDRHIANGLPSKNVNTMCPMLGLTYVYEEVRNPAYEKVLLEWADYALFKLPRAGEGGIQHIVSGQSNDGQLWIDTLYMTVLFIARMGVLFGNEDMIEESIYQFLVHIKHLADIQSGLFFHGWSFIERRHFSNVLWGRGNSWYTAGVVDFLDIVPLENGIKRYLISTLLTQALSLKKLQDVSGLWHTVINDNTSYLESSASCAFAYGILKAVRKGYLDKEFLEVGIKALNGVLSKIDDNGILHGVSYGTPVFRTAEEYKNVPVCPMPYGQSMALMLLVEALKLI